MNLFNCKHVICILFAICFLACAHEPIIVAEIPAEPKTITYLALGDSYTIGHNVPAPSSFPFQLQSKLIVDKYTFTSDPKIIAKTGWTCSNLSKAIDDAKLTKYDYDLVTLLIGVNDQYIGNDINYYPANFTALINKALVYTKTKNNLIVLSIPDYSVTPFGGNSTKIAQEIAAYNKINKEISESMGIKYINITPISQKAKNDLTYLATDKLHPSEKMYKEWVEEMYDEVLEVVK